MSWVSPHRKGGEGLAAADAALPRIVTYSDKWDPRVWRMLRSARLAGWVPGRSDQPIVVGYGEPYGGFVDMKVRKAAEQLRRLPPDQIVLMLDGSDVAVLGSPEEAVAKYAEVASGSILFTTTDGCWIGKTLPHKDPLCSWQESGPGSISPYLNSGSYMGRAGDVLSAMREILASPDLTTDDQFEWMKWARVHAPVLDTRHRVLSTATHRMPWVISTYGEGRISFENGSTPVTIHVSGTGGGERMRNYLSPLKDDEVIHARVPMGDEAEDPIYFDQSNPDVPPTVGIVLDSHLDTQEASLRETASALNLPLTIASGVRLHNVSKCPFASSVADRGEISSRSSCAAHLRVLQHAKTVGLKELIVMESDAVTSSGAAEIRSAISTARASGSSLHMLGYCQSHAPDASSKIEGNVYRATPGGQLGCGHAYYLTANGIDKVLTSARKNRFRNISKHFHAMLGLRTMSFPPLIFQNHIVFGSTKTSKKPINQMNLFRTSLAPMLKAKCGSGGTKPTGLAVASLVGLIVTVVGTGALPLSCGWRPGYRAGYISVWVMLALLSAIGASYIVAKLN